MARKYLARDVRLSDERPRRRAHGRAARSGRLRARRRRARRRRRRDQHVQRARARRGEALHAPRVEISPKRPRLPAVSDAKPIIAVTGCVAQQEGEALRQPRRRDRRHRRHAEPQGTAAAASRAPPTIIGPASTSIRTRTCRFRSASSSTRDPVRARVTIIEGCNEYCSFCVVPYTRGHERMRPAADIVAEVRAAAESGRREVQLLGQIVNHYQAPDDPRCDFAALLERVSAVAGIDRVRFASPHPRHVTPRLIAAIRDLPKVCKHLHMPVQSGSNGILQRDAAPIHPGELSRARRDAARGDPAASRSRPT